MRQLCLNARIHQRVRRLRFPLDSPLAVPRAGRLVVHLINRQQGRQVIPVDDHQNSPPLSQLMHLPLFRHTDPRTSHLYILLGCQRARPLIIPLAIHLVSRQADLLTIRLAVLRDSQQQCLRVAQVTILQDIQRAGPPRVHQDSPPIGQLKCRRRVRPVNPLTVRAAVLLEIQQTDLLRARHLSPQIIRRRGRQVAHPVCRRHVLLLIRLHSHLIDRHRVLLLLRRVARRLFPPLLLHLSQQLCLRQSHRHFQLRGLQVCQQLRRPRLLPAIQRRVQP